MIKYLDLKAINAQYSKEIDKAILRVSHSGWYLLGKECESFEKNYANYIGTKHCVTCGNGLDALKLIFRAYLELGIFQEGDEIIVPANTYIASILAITENHLQAVLVEPKLETLEIDEEAIESHLSSRTKGILIVHLYGRCAFTEKINAICQKYGLLLIEDNAQAHGCQYSDGRKTGALGQAAGHSFYPGKNLGAMGDAGAVTTNDDELASIVRTLANYGSPQKYHFTFCGRNSRMDEIQAAILNVRLKHLDEDNCRRQQVANYYYDNIHWGERLNTMVKSPEKSNVYHIFPIITPERDKLQKYLYSLNIQTLIHYPIPPHKQKCYPNWNGLSLPVTEKIHAQELSLPISPVIDNQSYKMIVQGINSFFSLETIHNHS